MQPPLNANRKIQQFLLNESQLLVENVTEQLQNTETVASPWSQFHSTSALILQTYNSQQKLQMAGIFI